MEPKNLYEACVVAGLEIDHYESDLLIRDSEKARELIGKYSKVNTLPFIDNINKEPWLAIPFAYQPFWDAVSKRAKEKLDAKDNPYSDNKTG